MCQQQPFFAPRTPTPRECQWSHFLHFYEFCGDPRKYAAAVSVSNNAHSQLMAIYDQGCHIILMTGELECVLQNLNRVIYLLIKAHVLNNLLLHFGLFHLKGLAGNMSISANSSASFVYTSETKKETAFETKITLQTGRCMWNVELYWKTQICYMIT